MPWMRLRLFVAEGGFVAHGVKSEVKVIKISGSENPSRQSGGSGVNLEVREVNKNGRAEDTTECFPSTSNDQ